MSKLKFPPPLTCSDITELLPAFARRQLDSERRGRIEGHLQSCDICLERLGDELAELKLQTVVAMFALFPQGKFGMGNVGLLWQRAIENETRLDSEAAEAVEKVRQQLNQFLVLLALRRPLRTLDAPTDTQDLPEKQITVVDQQWQTLTEHSLECKIESGPQILSTGKFQLKISGSDRHIASFRNKTIICDLDLSNGQKISFESKIDAVEITFSATGLPRPSSDLNISVDRIALYIIV